MLPSFYNVIIFAYILSMLICIRLILQFFPVQHFPNEVSRTILKGKRKSITLIDDQTQRKYKCRLIIAERASYEKYLGGQWFNFCRERVMEEGGKLIFYLEKSLKNLHVQVVPKQIFVAELFDLLLFWRIVWTVIVNYLDLGMPFVLFILWFVRCKY